MLMLKRPGVALAVRGLEKAFGERVALAPLSFCLEAGQGLALLGPNGSGKTTLLSLCAGALAPDAGSVTVQGESVQRASARRRLGFVPQQTALYEELSGEENVTFFGRLLGLRGPVLRAGVAGALEAAGLGEARALRASSYSGGMQRRLSVACALVHAPVLLLLDEPFVGIDDASKRKLCELLLARKRAGLALVLSTHDPAEARLLCERSLALPGGVSERERAAFAPPGAAQRAQPAVLAASRSRILRGGSP